jgi:hypothetical protein
MAGRHIGSRRSSAPNGLRLREAFRGLKGGQSGPRGRGTRREMSTLHRRLATPVFLLRRHGRIFGTARRLLLFKGVMLLLQRRRWLARRCMPMLGE